MKVYFILEDKPIEIKSAMLWGALWLMREIKTIEWEESKSIYGGFMSKQMNLR